MNQTRSKVAIVRTRPETVLEDYGRVMRLAGYRDVLPSDREIALKINITWHTFYPACSSPPWQIDGILKTLLEDGYAREQIYAAHNRTVVVSARVGEVNNNQRQVVERYGIRNVHLYEPEEEWVQYTPKGKLLALPEIYPDGIRIPKRLIGSSVIHCPTVKTHVFTTMTGAMKNAFGGLLFEKRHWTHSVIHETLVDLLTLQREIHPGILAVMDGTFAGDGPGPRCMRWHEKNVLLASSDPVAIDAVAAQMMGFDPMKIACIRLAHEHGLGCGDLKRMEIVGDADAAEERWHFRGQEDTLASRGQKAIYWGPLKPLEKFLLRTWIAPWSYLASVLYHDVLWYPLVGRWRVMNALKTQWGQLFLSYGKAQVGFFPPLRRVPRHAPHAHDANTPAAAA